MLSMGVFVWRGCAAILSDVLQCVPVRSLWFGCWWAVVACLWAGPVSGLVCLSVSRSVVSVGVPCAGCYAFAFRKCNANLFMVDGRINPNHKSLLP